MNLQSAYDLKMSERNLGDELLHIRMREVVT